MDVANNDRPTRSRPTQTNCRRERERQPTNPVSQLADLLPPTGPKPNVSEQDRTLRTPQPFVCLEPSRTRPNTTERRIANSEAGPLHVPALQGRPRTGQISRRIYLRPKKPLRNCAKLHPPFARSPAKHCTSSRFPGGGKNSRNATRRQSTADPILALRTPRPTPKFTTSVGRIHEVSHRP